MELNVEHNLTEDELFKAIVSLAKSSGLQERVHESLAKALPGCDCTEKEPRDPVIKELKRRTFDVFWQEARTGIADTVEKILTGDHDSSWLDLFKAKPARVYPSGPLTREQVQAIQQAIRDRFNYIAATLDSDYRPDDLTLRRWKKQGIVDTSVTASDFAATIPGSLRAVKNAFVFGRMHLAIEKGARTYDDILRVALTAPLTKPDTYAVQVAEQQAAKYVTQFGEHLATETVNLALAKNRQIVKDMTIKLHQHTLKQVPLNDFAEEKHVATWQQFKSELYHTMDDKARDWDRIGFYELHDAKRHGEALRLLEKFGPEQLVYKTPLTTACAQCKHLYLNGNVPRLFRLAEMLSYGTNVGRKPMPTRGGAVTSDERPDGEETLKPVAGLVHPWCECSGPFIFTEMEWWADQAVTPP